MYWVFLNFFKRKNEYTFKDKNSVVYNHINSCDGIKYSTYFLNIYHVQTERDKFDKRIYSVATVNGNNRMGRGRRGLQTTKIPMAFFKKYQFPVELFPKCRYHFFFYIPNIRMFACVYRLQEINSFNI